MHTQSRADGCGSVIVLGTRPVQSGSHDFEVAGAIAAPVPDTISQARCAESAHVASPDRPLVAVGSAATDESQALPARHQNGRFWRQPLDDSPRVTRGRAESPICRRIMPVWVHAGRVLLSWQCRHAPSALRRWCCAVLPAGISCR
jgi:hypothetical protein